MGRCKKTFRRVKVSGRGYVPGIRGRIFTMPPPKKKSAAPDAGTPETAKGGDGTTRSASMIPSEARKSKEDFER